MKVTFSKNTTENVWYKNYYIYVNDKYAGWIAKYNKNMDYYDVFSSVLSIDISHKNNEYTTLNEAKRYIRERVKQIYKLKGEKHE